MTWKYKLNKNVGEIKFKKSMDKTLFPEAYEENLTERGGDYV